MVRRLVNFLSPTIGLLLLVLSANAVRAEDAPAAVSFSRDVAPILIKHCQACHSAADAKGGYQVTSYNLVLKPGDSESPPITAGKLDESELVNLITSEDADTRMPKDADPLTAVQIELIKRWVSEGAKYDAADPAAALSSIAPRGTHADPPEVYRRPVPIAALAFHPGGAELAASGYREVTIWNAADGSLLRRIKNIPPRVYAIAYNPAGTLLAVAGGTPGESGEVKLFNPADGTLVKDLGSMPDVAYAAAFNPAGTKLAVGGADRAIRVYDAASGKQEILIEDHADWVAGLSWNHDGTRLASASRDKTSKLFNGENGDSLMTYSGQGEPIFDVGFSADGKLVYTAGADKKIHAWNPEDGAKKGEIGGFGRDVLALLTHEGQIFCGSADKSVRQYQAEGLKHVRNYEGLADAAYAVAYHPGTKRLAAGSFAGEVRVWNADDGATVVHFIAAPGYKPAAPVAAK